MRSRRASPSVRSPSRRSRCARRGLGLGPVRAPAAAHRRRAADRDRPLLAHLAASTLARLRRRARRVRHRRGVRSSYRCWRRPRPGAPEPDAARRSAWSRCRSTSGWPSGRPRRGCAPGAGGYPAVWIVAAVLAGGRRGPGHPAAGDGACRPYRRPANASGRACSIPRRCFPGLLVRCGACGMAGFLAFIPLYAREIGLDGAAIPLAVYALIVVGLRLVVRQAARPGRGRPTVRWGARDRGDRPPPHGGAAEPARARRWHGGLRGRRRVHVSGAAVAGGLARRRDGAGNGRGDDELVPRRIVRDRAGCARRPRAVVGVRRRLPRGCRRWPRSVRRCCSRDAPRSRSAIPAAYAQAHDRGARVRRRRRADGARHRPGPRGDRQACGPVRAGAGARRGRPRPDRGQPRPVRREGPALPGGPRRDAGAPRPDGRPRRGRRRGPRGRGGVRGPRRQVAAVGRAGPHRPARTPSSPPTPRRSPSTGWPRRSPRAAAPGSSACTSSAPCR